MPGSYQLLPSPALMAKRRKLLEQIEKGTLTEEAAFRKALEYDPEDAFALTGLGTVCQQRGEHDEARGYYWRAMRTDPAGLEACMFLFKSLMETDDDPELLASLQYLAFRRLLCDPQREDRLRESWLKAVRELIDTSNLKSDPEKFRFLIRTISAERSGEPERVTELLRPYRLIFDLVDPPPEGMDPETVNDIIEHGAECVPLLVGILRRWLQDELPTPGFFPAEAALALLGEIGDPAAFPVVLEFTDAEDEQLGETAVWAARRAAMRSPKLASKVRDLPSADPDLTVYDFCCIPPEEEEPPAPPVTARGPGRNDPCWCGSGKKYKKCHLDADQKGRREAATTNEASGPPGSDERISGLLLLFLKEHLSEREMDKAFETFFWPPPSEEPDEADRIAFFDWLLNDYRLPRFGRPAVEEYLARHGGRLAAEDRSALQDWVKNWSSLFEVQRVEKGKGIEVKDLLLGGTYFIHDVSSSNSLVRWDRVFSRVRPEGDRYVFTATGLHVPLSVYADLRDWILAEQESAGEKLRSWLRFHSHRVRQECLELHSARRQNLQVVSAEGDPLVFCKAVYRVRNRKALLDALEASPVIGDREDDKGETRLTWYETGETGDFPRRILGSLALKGDRLTLECNSRQRLERGTELISRLASGAVEEKRREFQSLEAAMRKARSSPKRELSSEVPPEIEREVMGKYLAEHYGNWPDMALPALDGLTPRQAAEKVEYHDRLTDLLKSMENGEERNRAAGRAWFDFSEIKRELGIDY